MGGWSTTKTANNRERRPYIKDEVDLAEFSNEYKSYRLVGPINSYAVTWNEFKNTKTGKSDKFSKICLDYDGEKGEYVRDICPYRKAELYMQQRFLTNLIDRELQQDKPRKIREPLPSETKRRSMLGEKWCLKNKDSKTYTFYRVWDLPGGAKDKIVSLTDLWHKRRTKAAKGKKIERVELSDPEFGCDLLIKFNPDAKGPAMWDINLDEASALTKSELRTPLYDIEHLKSIEPEKLEVAKKEWEGLKKRLITRDKDGKIVKNKVVEDEDEDDEDLEDETPKKKKNKNKVKTLKKSSKSSKNKFNSSDLSPPWDTSDSKTKKIKKSKDKPSSKSSSKSAKAKKKLARDLDDDLDDM